MNRRDLLKRAVAVAAAPLAPIAQRFGQPSMAQIERFGRWCEAKGAAAWFLQNSRDLTRGIRLMPPEWNQVGAQTAMRRWDDIVREGKRLGIVVRMWP